MSIQCTPTGGTGGSWNGGSPPPPLTRQGVPIGGWVLGGQFTCGGALTPGSVAPICTWPGPVLISNASKRPLPVAEPTGAKPACKRKPTAGTRVDTRLDRTAPAVPTAANATTATSESAPLQ